MEQREGSIFGEEGSFSDQTKAKAVLMDPLKSLACRWANICWLKSTFLLTRDVEGYKTTTAIDEDRRYHPKTIY